MINITNKGNKAKVEILTDIGEGFFTSGFTLEKLRAELQGLDADEVDIEIKSNGGDALEALAIYDELRRMPAKVSARYVGTSASAATIIGSAADTREITENSRFLVHQVQAVKNGTADDFKKVAEQMEKIDNDIVAIYRRVTGKSRSDLLNLMKEDRWLTAKEALQWGFVTKILKNEPQLSNQKTEKMEEKTLKLLNVKTEEQAHDAVELLIGQLAEYKAKVEDYEKEAAERQQAEIDAFIQAQKESGLAENLIPALTNLAKADLENARKIAEGFKPQKLKDVVDTTADKPEAIDKDKFYANFKAGVYHKDKDKYREDFKAVFGYEPK